jgi:CYTH domain-containing protein
VVLADGTGVDLDRYHGTLAGLVTVEVEFPDVASAESFAPPAWFGTEVTGRPEWSNAALARSGRPA